MTVVSMADYFVNAKEVLNVPWSGSSDLARDSASAGIEADEAMDDLTD